MIETLLLKNFQSHKHSKLNFHRGVNVIVGPSDSGKTALVRGIRWLVYNRPLGDDFRSNWGGDTVVQLCGDVNISREIQDKPKKSFYVVGDAKFKALATKVPDEVTVALNMGDVNIQQQMDSPFLISETAGEVAAHFNRIANIDIIDKSLKKSRSTILNINQTIKQREEDIEEKQLQLLEYVALDLAESDIEVLEELNLKKIREKASVNSLKLEIGFLLDVNLNIANENDFLQHEDKIVTLVDAINKRADIELQLYQVEGLVFQLKVKEGKIQKKRALLIQKDRVQNLIEKLETRRGVSRDIMELRLLVSKYTTTNKKLHDIEDNLVVLQDKMPEVCPLCKGKGKLK